MRTPAVLLVLATAAACGTSSPAAPVDAAVAPHDAYVAPDDAYVPVDAYVPDDANAPVTTQSLTIGPFNVDMGTEQTLCVALDLGNASPMLLRAVRTHITEGSHHLVVSRADGTPVSTTATPCAPLTHGIGQAIFIAESRESGIAYPPGTGLPFVAHQVIGLELHMINLTPGPIDISGTVDLDLVPADPAIREVQILFTGDLTLSLPPHVDTTDTSYWPMTPGTEIIALTTHTHQLGIDATLDVTQSTSDPGTRVHESMSWSDPPLTLFDPRLIMQSGDEIRLTCTFRNTTDSTVHFGTGFNDEMCFFWAYYLDPV